MVGESQTRNNNGCAHAFLSEGILVRKKKWNKKLGTTCSLDIENELGTFAMFVRKREETHGMGRSDRQKVSPSTTTFQFPGGTDEMAGCY